MPAHDPYRCDQCRIYTQPEAAAELLERMYATDAMRCRDRQACNLRVVRQRELDRLIKNQPADRLLLR